eukprot:scaffold8212_cov93-Cylindrotheca_fusiformis.AAC.9
MNCLKHNKDTTTSTTSGEDDSVESRGKEKKGGTRSTTTSSSSSKNKKIPAPDDDSSSDERIVAIQEAYGHLMFHGTGNPLNVRSPNTPETLAVDHLANIIQSGSLGQVHHQDSNTNTTPELETEQGNEGDGAFWADRLQLAGQYGWTGIVLAEDTDTSKPVQLSEMIYFLVSDQQEKDRLRSKLTSSSSSSDETKSIWEDVKDRLKSKLTSSSSDDENKKIWEDVKDRTFTIDELAKNAQEKR